MFVDFALVVVVYSEAAGVVGEREDKDVDYKRPN